MSSASSSKKHCAKEHEDAPKNKQNRIEIDESTQGNLKEELEVEVGTASKAAVMILSASSNLNKKVNLTIDRERKFGEWMNKPPRQDISNLKSMVVKYFDIPFRDFFKSHNFPEIENLRIECSLETEECELKDEAYKWVIEKNFNAIFSGMKDLKKLYIRSNEPYMDQIDAPFSLESVDVHHFFRFIEHSRDTLKQFKLCDDRLYFKQFIDLYENYPKLEELTTLLHIYGKCEEVLPKNERIKHLDLHIQISTSSFNNTNAEKVIERTYSDYLELVLASSPSLETLTMYMPISEDFVRFLARTMPKLKKVIGRGGAMVDALDVLEKLKTTRDDNFINTEFEICLEEIRSWGWEETLRQEEIMKRENPIEWKLMRMREDEGS